MKLNIAYSIRITLVCYPNNTITTKVEQVKIYRSNALTISIMLQFLLFVATLYSTTTNADEITLAADLWCPYNCQPKEENPGFLIEIAKYSLEKQGHTVKYHLVPWQRAIRMVRKGQYHGLVGSPGKPPRKIQPRRDRLSRHARQ